MIFILPPTFTQFSYVRIMFFHNLNKCVLWCSVSSLNDTERAHNIQWKCMRIWLFHHHYDYDCYYNCVARHACVRYMYVRARASVHNLIWSVQLQVFGSLCETKHCCCNYVSHSLCHHRSNIWGCVCVCMSLCFRMCLLCVIVLKVFPRW